MRERSGSEALEIPDNHFRFCGQRHDASRWHSEIEIGANLLKASAGGKVPEAEGQRTAVSQQFRRHHAASISNAYFVTRGHLAILARRGERSIRHTPQSEIARLQASKRKGRALYAARRLRFGFTDSALATAGGGATSTGGCSIEPISFTTSRIAASFTWA